MTPLPPAPRATVAAALTDIAALGSFFSVAAGETGGAWRPVTDAYAEGLAHLVSERTARYGTREPRIAASIVQLGHAARLWSPVLGCLVLHGVLLDLGDLQQEADGPGLRLPEPRGWTAPPGEAPISEIYRLVMTEHLARLAAGLRVKVAPRLLYGNAASALAEAAREILRARPVRGRDAGPLARSLLDTGDLRGTGVVTGPDLRFRRRSCCLYYRVPGARKCGDCALDRAR
ncbi:(2Fe-2S)-binding protein [Planotetraspora phitsanulokensis]|uniref:Ferric siderophore reductase C-terminal domain-containing protein n=1 Tax=Planotetraspora phitsanulokensis TaxID=575192 RepID=A0A8J3TZT2_9ACTN|nr:(2Fe-2S)-binding protein [Planotetraspora phitsanulokensis]GII35803.1 hypothetical protein Pph01_08060 [Planotetraspora phitsanulokensis]